MLQCATNAGNQEENLSVSDNNQPNNKKRHILRLILVVIGVFFCLLFFYLSFYKVTPLYESLTVELGDGIDVEPSFYLEGKEWSVNLSKCDFSQVNVEKNGEYVMNIHHVFEDYPVNITVKDTTAPSVEFKSENYVCETGRTVTPSDFVSSVIDCSDTVSLRFLNTESDTSIKLGEDGENASFTETGVHPVTLIATDDSGNNSNYYMSMVVDSAPIIYGVSEFYVAVGAQADFLNSIKSYDAMDGTLTEDVVYDINGPYNTNPGDYTITYSSTDSLGLTGTLKGTVHSLDPYVLQDMVNTGRINPFSDHVYGVINPYDAGYNQDENVEEAVNNIKNAVVRMYYKSANSTTYGSGYIVKIDKDNIILCTNKHVVGNRADIQVCFYDGTEVTAEVVAGVRTPDVAFVNVANQLLSKETFSNLKTVHINLDYYKSISSKPRFEMGMYCCKEDGSEWLTRYGYIVRKSGVLAEYFANFDYPVMEVSVKLTPGVSGSAIIDSHGNLLCMAAFYWDHNGNREYYGVSLEDILDYYEEVFGERLEYY